MWRVLFMFNSIKTFLIAAVTRKTNAKNPKTTWICVSCRHIKLRIISNITHQKCILSHVEMHIQHIAPLSKTDPRM